MICSVLFIPISKTYQIERGGANMGNTKQGKSTREIVFEFYAKHASSCDCSYETAEDKDIYKLYSDVKNMWEKNTLFAKTSIIILTANKYERNILHQKVYGTSRNKIQRIEIELFTACQRFKKAFAYWFEWNGYSVLNIHANVTGSYTIGGSADIVRWVFSNKYLFPMAIISFGICFGTMQNNSELGDVVISRKVYPYFIGAKINGERISVVDDNAFIITDNLDNRIRDLENSNRLNGFEFKVKFKNYITGEAVVSSGIFRDKFVDITTQEIYAGDMEGYGLFKECSSYPYSVPCLIVKSICDWADEKNFNTNDEEIISEFKAIFYRENSKTTINEINILDTLKDRLQAYSASCAFEVLGVFMDSRAIRRAIFDDIKDWITNFNGKATTCKKVHSIAVDSIKKSNLGFSVSESFIHRCLIILEESGIIKCDPACRCAQYKEDKCSVSELRASIDVIKEG